MDVGFPEVPSFSGAVSQISNI